MKVITPPRSWYHWVCFIWMNLEVPNWVSLFGWHPLSWIDLRKMHCISEKILNWKWMKKSTYGCSKFTIEWGNHIHHSLIYKYSMSLICHYVHRDSRPLSPIKSVNIIYGHNDHNNKSLPGTYFPLYISRTWDVHINQDFNQFRYMLPSSFILETEFIEHLSFLMPWRCQI